MLARLGVLVSNDAVAIERCVDKSMTSFLLALAFFLAMGRGYVTSDLRALVFVGIFGGYTTMSTFGLETVALLAEGQLGWAAGNIFLNGGLCVVGAYLGRTVGMLLGGA